MEAPVFLLAKRAKQPTRPMKKETLLGHTECVFDASQIILDFLRSASSVDIKEDDWVLIEKLSFLSAIFHDIGKANNIFQGMLKGEKEYYGRNHPVRHEILSSLLIAKLWNDLSEWINSLSRRCSISYKDDIPLSYLISWIVGGHHLRLNGGRSIFDEYPIRETNIPITGLTFFAGHEDVAAILDIASRFAGDKHNIPCKDMVIYQGLEVDRIKEKFEEFVYESEEFRNSISEELKNSLAISKAVLIASDVSASALARNYNNMKAKWMEKALNNLINKNELERIVRSRLGNNYKLFGFQTRIAQSKRQCTLVLAACGSGKTIAAYKWAQEWAQGRKLFFCYPTTGTASAGFADYLLAQSSIERDLIHSRSSVDLEYMLSGDEEDEFFIEGTLKIDSLRAWPQKIIACTADVVLGLVQNNRRGLFSFPAIMLGAFVFDEVHSYDRRLFGSLLTFLKVFNKAPVLLMSASLPKSRIEAIKKAVDDRLSSPIFGDERREGKKRYSLSWMKDKEACLKRAEHALKEKKKVLWICNTVGRAIELYDLARECYKRFDNLQIHLYHSRYKYADRIEKQKRVLESFKNHKYGKRPTLVIATQVCEMSLDISADIMVSELPPFPFLIQRLGRVNRDEEDFMEIGEKEHNAFIYRPEEAAPYELEDLDLSEAIIRSKILDKPISQKELARILDELQEEEEYPDSSAWVDGCWESFIRPVREGEETIPIVLAGDIPSIKAKLGGQRPTYQNLAPWVIPMPIRRGMRFDSYFGGFPVIDDDYVIYDKERGAQWALMS